MIIPIEDWLVNCTFSFEFQTQVLILILGKLFTLPIKTGYIPCLNFANGPLSCWISCQWLRLRLRWGQNIHGCSPLCFSAVQDEQRRAPRTTTSKNISGLAALGCAAGSTQNNGLESFLESFVAIICPVLEFSSNLRMYHWVRQGLQDHDLEKCIWICCFRLCSIEEHTIQMDWWSVLI